MRSVTRGSLRLHARRYVAAVLAVVIGVTFVVTTDALASAARSGVLAGLDDPYRAADAVVTDVDAEEAARLVERAADRGDAAGVVGWTYLPVSGPRLAVEDAAVGVVPDDDAMRWQVVRQGRLPEGGGEAVVDVNAAKSNGVTVGERLRVGSGAEAVEVRVVGLVDTPSASVRAALYLPWSDVVAWRDALVVDSVAYAGDPGPVAGGGRVEPVDRFLQERAASLTAGVDVLSYVLLLFAAIALAVSVLVIANTFSILFAQRSRDLALLRCVGATRRQVTRSVRVEALVIGVAASALGVLAGAGTGVGVVALVRALFPAAPLGAVEFSPAWLAGGFALGVIVTLVASWLPTRRVVRTSPLAALRPDQGVELHTAAGRLRTGAGVLLVLGGVALLALAVGTSTVPVMLAGGFASFAGLMLLGPLVVPALLRLAGPPAGRLAGPAGRLAAGNAVRNPRRTAATTASLLIGVTLTTAVLTGLASSRAAVDDEMAAQHPIDVTVTASGGLDEATVEGLGRVAGVDDVVAVPGAAAEVSDGVGTLPLVAAPDDADRVAHGPLPRPTEDVVRLPWDLVPDTGRVTVTTSAGSLRLRVVGGEGWGEAALISSDVLAALAPQPRTTAVWLRANDDADAENLVGDVAALASAAGADQTSGLAQRRYVDLQLDVLTASVVGMLAIAVVIALVGIGNTLGLSVLERGREHALLRALGLTRRQLRGTLAVEAVLLSGVAAVLGTAVGVAYAWVGVATMVRPAVDGAAVTLPWGQLGLVVLVAGLAGLAAAVLPARRVARVVPAQGLAQE